jgi:hypothetical protein
MGNSKSANPLRDVLTLICVFDARLWHLLAIALAPQLAAIEVEANEASETIAHVGMRASIVYAHRPIAKFHRLADLAHAARLMAMHHPTAVYGALAQQKRTLPYHGMQIEQWVVGLQIEPRMHQIEPIYLQAIGQGAEEPDEPFLHLALAVQHVHRIAGVEQQRQLLWACLGNVQQYLLVVAAQGMHLKTVFDKLKDMVHHLAAARPAVYHVAKDEKLVFFGQCHFLQQSFESECAAVNIGHGKPPSALCRQRHRLNGRIGERVLQGV